MEETMKYLLILITLSLFQISCTANMKDKVIRDSNDGFCDRAITVFEKYATGEKAWQTTKKISGTMASGAITGAVMVTETLIYAAPGIAVGAILCSPVIALEVAAHSSGRASGDCIVRFVGASAAHFGNTREASVSRDVWEMTKPWRMASYDELSQMLRSVAQCYAVRATPEDLSTAEKQLRSIHESFWDKLSIEEQKQVDMLTSHINNRLNIPP
jgi:hypothetical protein